jgi:hypothetical protein
MAFAAPAVAQDERVEQLEQQMQQMQQQFEQQMRRMQAEIERLKESGAETADTVERVEQQVTDREPIASSGSDELALTISGQINRAFNVVDDGDKTKFYAVDNDVTNTRFRLVGEATVDDWTFNSVLEQALSANNSYDVSQDNESSGDFLDTRKAELSARNDRFGAFFGGKGQGASDDVAEYDLSLVALGIMYSGVADPVGGIQFTESGNLTGETIGDAYANFDGLGRYNRLMYVSPNFGGAQLAGSVGDDQQWDLALKFGYDYNDWTGIRIGPFTTLAGVAISDPSEPGVDYRLNGSVSTIHDASGLGLTLAAGGDDADRDNPYFVYGKLSWDADFFDFGDTGFGVDLQYNENVLADNDSGYSLGVAALQQVDALGADFYAQLRYFDYDNDEGPSFDSVLGATTGFLVRF